MKKVYTILAGSLMSLFAFAGGGYDDGKLSVTYAGSGNIKISVDGDNYPDKDNSVMIDNLQPGYHTVTVYRERDRDRSRRGWGWNLFGRNRDELLYSGSVSIKPRTLIDVTISKFGQALVHEERLGGYGDRDYNDNSNNGYPYDKDYRNGDDRGNNSNNNDGGWNNGYGNVMNDREFNDVKDQIRKEWLENNRLTSVKTIMDKTNFTTRQVKELMLLFTFENNRLEVAKYGYRKTVDKQNYFQVNDAFTFSSSMDELARFIRESR